MSQTRTAVLDELKDSKMSELVDSRGNSDSCSSYTGSGSEYDDEDSESENSVQDS